MEADYYENPFVGESNQYANKFDEAFNLENWDATKLLIKECENIVQLHPDDYFNMATGNIGVALLYYSMIVHDPGHQDYLNHFAYRYLKLALKAPDSEVHPKAKKYFQGVIDEYDEQYVSEFLEKPLHINKYTWDNNEETDYRNWCLKNHLFLNPLNDLILEHSCFAADTLQLPGIVTSIKEKDIPIYFGLFNQIKQEFIYAC